MLHEPFSRLNRTMYRSPARRAMSGRRGMLYGAGSAGLVFGAYALSKRNSGRNGIIPNSSGGYRGIYGV